MTAIDCRFKRVRAHYVPTASDTFFTDDLAENIAGAESIGATGHLYVDEASLLAAIDAYAARETLLATFDSQPDRH